MDVDEIPEKYVEKFRQLKGKDADLNELKQIYERSLITPGEAVGIVAAQSVGEASTQLTLRTKHAAGVSAIKVTSGLPRLVEIFDAKKNIATPSMTIYLDESLSKSKEKALAFANSIIHIKVDDLVSSYSTELKRKELIFLFDREAMESYGITFRDVESRLKPLNLEMSVEGNELHVIDKTADAIKKLIRTKARVTGTTVSGISGIERAVVLQADDGSFYVSTAGTNLKEIMKLDGVDKSRTISNDIIEVADVLGIEPARALIVSEASSTLEAVGLMVDVRHLLLMSDTMCATGSVRGMNRYGIAGEMESILSRASFEIPLKHLVDAAILHELDRFEYVANNVMSNQVVPVGTGTVKLVVRKDGRGDKKDTSGEDKSE